MKMRWRARSNAGDYYEIADTNYSHPISVVHTKFDTFVCLTCRSVDCAHATFAEAHYEDTPVVPWT